jgi:hypothetical protein
MTAQIAGGYNPFDNVFFPPSPAPAAPVFGPSQLVGQAWSTSGALAITAVLVGSSAPPRPVQIVVVGLAVGLPYSVTASAPGWSRVVQGGAGTAAATQLVLIDVATPLNTPITYTVTHNGSTVSTLVTVTVAYAGDAVLQSLDGRTIAGFDWQDNADPRAQEPRVGLYRPAGSARAIMHYDVAGDESGIIVAETSGADTVALRELVRAGAPVVLRAEVGLRDVDPVEVIGIRTAPRHLVGAVGDLRRWDLGYTLVADEDVAPLVIATLAHVNTYYAAQTLAALNAQWAGLTMADLNAFDWVGATS